MRAAAIRYHHQQRMCLGCGVRRALFVAHGRFKRDHKHDLCFRCWRGALAAARKRISQWRP